jgi:hypothetical protein
VQEKEEIAMDVVRAELVGGLLEVGGEWSDMEDVDCDGFGGAVA